MRAKDFILICHKGTRRPKAAYHLGIQEGNIILFDDHFLTRKDELSYEKKEPVLLFRATFNDFSYSSFNLMRKSDIARHTFTVEVRFKYGMWEAGTKDPIFNFLAGATSDSITSSTATAVLNDTYARSTPTTFTITAVIYDAEAASKATLTVTGAYFDNVTYELNENEWIMRDGSGTGSDFTLKYEAA